MKKLDVYKLININAGLILLVSMLSMTLLMSGNSYADDSYVSTATIRVAESCSITSTLDTPHIAYLPAGIYSGNYNSDGHDYRNGIGKTTIKAFCNDSAGFSIYAIGYTNDTFGNNTLIGPDNNTIATGTAVSGNTSNWSMKIGQVTGTYAPTLENGYGSYKAVPSTYDKVASFNSVTDLTNGSSITTTYAAYIASTQAPGTYNGKVKYTLVHPVDEAPLQPQVATPRCINYFANASNAIGTMGCQSATDNASVTLLASNFSRTGYGFAGWTNKFDYATNPNQAGIKFYGPQETITVPTGTTSNGLSLYAVWVKSAGSLQDNSKVSELCGTGTSSLTTAPTDGTANLSSVSALTDQRDNNTYAIAKLADGKCWMIENLRLENTAEHNSDGTLAQGYGISTTYGNFAGLAEPESADFTNSTTANSLYYSGTQEGTASINIGTTSDPGYRFPRYNNWNNQSASANRPQNPTTNTATNSTTNAGMYSYGNYYTWSVAIADTTYYYSSDHNTTSICPTGWQIPLGDTSTGNIDQGEADTANKVPGFSYLDRKMGGTGQNQSTAADSLRWRKFPVNFLYSGYFNTSSAYTRGSLGYYWSSTASLSSLSYGLSLDSSNVCPGTYNYNKYYGYSIRCTIGS